MCEVSVFCYQWFLNKITFYEITKHRQTTKGATNYNTDFLAPKDVPYPFYTLKYGRFLVERPVYYITVTPF